MSSKYILSLGSNCEVGMMINRKYNNIYSNLFNWTNITLDNLILILNNLEPLYNNDNYKIVYRLFSGTYSVYSSKSIDDFRKYYLDNPNNYVAHIDYDFYIDNKYIFWSHGIIEEDINKIINCNLDSLENYKSIIFSKINHLVENTISVLNNNTDIIKVYIKCLKNEYTLESLTNLENMPIFNRPNIYIGIICECDENINIHIKNKNIFLVRCNKLTDHNEAIYSELYNTQEKYFYLFETIDRLASAPSPNTLQQNTVRRIKRTRNVVNIPKRNLFFKRFR